MVLLMLFFFTTAFSAPSQGNNALAMFKVMFALDIATMLVMFGLLTFFIVYVFKTDTVPSDKKALWAVVLFLGNMVSIPIFWYLYVWRHPSVPEQTPKQAL